MYRLLATSEGGAQQGRKKTPLSSVAFLGESSSSILTTSVTGSVSVWTLSQASVDVTGTLPALPKGEGIVSAAVSASGTRVVGSTFSGCVFAFDVQARAVAGGGKKDSSGTLEDSGSLAVLAPPFVTQDKSLAKLRPWRIVIDPEDANSVLAASAARKVLQIRLPSAASTHDDSHSGEEASFSVLVDGGLDARYPSVPGVMPSSMSTAPNGKFIAVGHVDGLIQVYLRGHCASGAGAPTIARVFQHALTHSIGSVAFTVDSELLLVGCGDGRVYLFDVRGGELLRSFVAGVGLETADNGGVLCVAASPAGQYFSAADAGGKVRVWDIDTAECVHQWDAGAAVTSISYCRDGTRLAVVSAAGVLHVCMVAVPTVV